MFNSKQFFFITCESPLHAGSGNELDFIDLTIQRERHTGFPKIESSTLKGALRERFFSSLSGLPAINGKTAIDLFKAAFGAESKQQSAGDERQGALAFTDARLLSFPVKSMRGVFAWITCPFVLKRFEEDMKRCNPGFMLAGDCNPASEKAAIVFTNNELTVITGSGNNAQHHVILEEYPFETQAAPSVLQIKETANGGGVALNTWLASKVFADVNLAHWKTHLEKNLVILPDNDFTDFTELSTEVITRNSIDPKTGTVKGTALFTEEYLPTDSVLYSIAMAHDEFTKTGSGISAADTMKFFVDNMTGSAQFNNAFRAGANETIGKGMLRTSFI